MQDTMKTTPAARHLGVPVYALLNWVRHGLLAAPPRDSSGHFVWGPEHLAAARRVAQRRRRPAAYSAVGPT